MVVAHCRQSGEVKRPDQITTLNISCCQRKTCLSEDFRETVLFLIGFIGFMGFIAFLGFIGFIGCVQGLYSL